MPHVTREGVEIRAVLEVIKALIELMLPDDAPRPIQIDKLEVDSSLGVLRERKAALQSGIRPFVRAGISVVDPRE